MKIHCLCKKLEAAWFVVQSQALFLNSVLHLGHLTIMLPLPRGMRIFWPQEGHLYI